MSSLYRKLVLSFLFIGWYASSAWSANCNPTGVSRNADGTYSFAKLVTDANGNVVDSSNPGCIVKLLGFNLGWANSGGVGYPDAQELAGWKQVIPFNVARLAVNVRWWHDNVKVPSYNNALFRDVVMSMIDLNRRNGIYTEIDIGTQFPYPPCEKGDEDTICTKQNQASRDFEDHCQAYINAGREMECLPWASYSSMYIPPDGTPSMAKLALADFARMYGNDPSIIYDLWNEPRKKDKINTPEDKFFKEMNERIALVHSIAPNALVVAFGNHYQDVQAGSYTYPAGNVLIDYHVYKNRFDGGDFVQDKLAFNRSHHWGTIINEYGGNKGKDASPEELENLYYVVRSGGVGILEWSPKKTLIDNKNPPYVLSDVGRMVCAMYSNLFGMSSVSCGSIPQGFPEGR